MSSMDRRAQLFRMEEARRQTQRHLEMIDRQIIRRMTAIFRSSSPNVSATDTENPPMP